MSEAVDGIVSKRSAALARDAKIIGLIGSAHFISHVYIMLLPPVLLLVQKDMGVSLVELAVAITAFNVISAFLQAPAGFAIDRFGARALLIAGLALGSVAIAVAALVPGYWVFVVAYAALGLANTVYHPADYSILSASIDPKRIGRAFSVHTFCGYVGGGVTPVLMIGASAIWGWRGAFLGAAVAGLVVALLLVAFGGVLSRTVASAKAARASAPKSAGKDGWALLLSAPILLNLFFFVLLALANGGLQTFLIPSLDKLYGTSQEVSGTALSAFLLFSAAGVLFGGWLADRTSRHERVAAIGFACTATMSLLIGLVDLGAVLLIAVMTVGGVLNGMIQPSRDMMVRAVTPPGSFGKVFGFVSTGFNVGGMISPILFAWLLENGGPRTIYYVVAAVILLAMATVLLRPKPPRPEIANPLPLAPAGASAKLAR